ncbi:DICT sensory domain-containing protein [Nocardioides taihuensis]|uniref:DICT sensory domain-containing protein n=1 Tax=Nocardioides taihuensis TaxID=1835606 RepID=A0ABW0BKU2_9ACTN
MNTALKTGPATGTLTIGELSERSGVAPATLRMWEQRHGWPVPSRLDSGHRRYDESVVAAVREAVRLRDSGLRLGSAIEQARQGPVAPPAPSSVYARIRRSHPGLVTHRLRKQTLLALSWAIEDEFCARADRPVLLGTFQAEEFYRSARPRWEALARLARAAYVFADFPEADLGATPAEVALDASSPLLREWTVVCDSAELPVALTAFELPGQTAVRDADRVFESIWTVDATVVRQASRVLLGEAAAAGAPGADAALLSLAGDVRPALVDPAVTTGLFNRIVAYVDRYGGGR